MNNFAPPSPRLLSCLRSAPLALHQRPPPPRTPSPVDPHFGLEPHEVNGPRHIQIGSRYLQATIAERIDPRRTVYRLKLKHASILDYISITCVRLILEKVLAWYPQCKDLRPEWFLPSTIIVKKQKPDWDKEFENEKRAYQVLQPLQGIVVPYHYGNAIYDGCPALVLSEVLGERLDHYHKRSADDDDFLVHKLDSAFKAINSYGIAHQDMEPHNVFDVGDRAMIIDLEQVEFEDVPWEESTRKLEVGHILREISLNRLYASGWTGPPPTS